MTCRLFWHRKYLFYLFAERDVASSYLWKFRIQFLGVTPSNVVSGKKVLSLCSFLWITSYFSLSVLIFLPFCVYLFILTRFDFYLTKYTRIIIIIRYFFYRCIKAFSCKQVQWTPFKNVLFKMVKIMSLSGICYYSKFVWTYSLNIHGEGGI